MPPPLFPYLQGLSWGRLKYARAGKTLTQESESGKEVRLITQIRPRWLYVFNFNVLKAYGSRGSLFGQFSNSNQIPPGIRMVGVTQNSNISNELAVLQGFIVSLTGSAGEFFYDDPADNTAGLYKFATADGVSSSWRTGFTNTATPAFIDQSPFVAWNVNAFNSWAASNVGGVISIGSPPSRGSPLYLANSVASTPATSYFGEQFATGDGASTAFQLTRSIGGYYSEPVQNLNNAGAAAVYINGVKQVSGYSIGATGIVTFSAAPANGAVLSWSGKFYQRLRFMKDEIEFEELYMSLWQGKKVEAISVLL